MVSQEVVQSRGEGTTDNIALFLHGTQNFSFVKEIRAFFTVFTFLTRLPGPPRIDHHPGYLMIGVVYFPVVGALIGLYTSIFYDFAFEVLTLPVIVCAILSTAASIWLTGCFHEDGLADTADGFGGGWTKEEILSIMQDTRLGTYGCACLILYFLAKIHLISSLGQSQWFLSNCRGGGPALIISHTLSRCIAAALMKMSPYVTESGAKSNYYRWFQNSCRIISWWRVLIVIFFGFILCFITYKIENVVILLVTIIIMIFSSAFYAKNVLGGIVGDFLGASTCMAEIAILLSINVFLQIETMNTDIKTMIQENDTRKVLDLFLSTIGNITSDRTGFDEPTLISGTSNKRWSYFRNISIMIIALYQWTNFMHREREKVKNRRIESSLHINSPNDYLHLSGMSRKDTENYCQNSSSSKKSDDLKVNSCNSNESNNNLNVGLSDIHVDQFEFSCRNPDLKEYERYFTSAIERMDTLAKPVKSLGTLEEWYAKLCALQRSNNPYVHAATLIFAGDHGVAKSIREGGESCSAYPQKITSQLLRAIKDGKAGLSVIAKSCNADVYAFDVGICDNPPEYSKIDQNTVLFSSKYKLSRGSFNMCKEKAIMDDDVPLLMKAGSCALDTMIKHQHDYKGKVITAVALGEIGIGNSTSAAALYTAIIGCSARDICGYGTGLDEEGLERKINIVEKAINFHADIVQSKIILKILAALGGAEIVALAGAIIHAYELRLAVIIDGYIVTAAALVAAKINPRVTESFFLATASAERGHNLAVEELQKISRGNQRTLSSCALHMGLRLGEGSGATLTIPLLHSASTLQQMAELKDLSMI